jgi:uncharacterized membrane protein
LPDPQDKKKRLSVSERIDRIRHEPLSSRRRLTAAAISGAVTLTVFYGILMWLGVTGFDWRLFLAILVVGVAAGFYWGVRSPAGGILAGIATAIWIILEIIAAFFAVIAAAIGFLFSGLG